MTTLIYPGGRQGNPLPARVDTALAQPNGRALTEDLSEACWGGKSSAKVTDLEWPAELGSDPTSVWCLC